MTQRVSDERLAEMCAEIQEEDARAIRMKQAHGNYGEDFGAAVFDLRDARARLRQWGAAESVDRQLELARERMEKAERGWTTWYASYAALLAAREAAAYARGVEDAAKVADELSEVETHVSGSVPMTGNLVQEASKMAARLTRKGIAKGIRALLPGTASAGSGE